jgi:hypothetical protein
MHLESKTASIVDAEICKKYSCSNFGISHSDESYNIYMYVYNKFKIT